MSGAGLSSNSNALPVAVDVMGGDHGPNVVVDGAVAAVKELKIPITLVGNESEISARLKRLGADNDEYIGVVHASEVITMEDSPARAIRTKSQASIRIAFELVKEGKAVGVVSPGNTGAMMAAGMFVSGNLQGIARPAIASLIPRVGDKPPTVFLDCGANIDCHATQLVQFALMGHFYARTAISAEAPRVALLSNGTESSKGTDIIRSAGLTLSDMEEINYIGYVEGRDISRDVADVVVCDGFVGNVVLKTMGGSVELVLDSIKDYVERSGRGKLGMWLAKPMFKSLFGQKLDPSSYGGAPLLGLNDIAIVCHGSAKSRAIMNGIRVARKLYDESLVEKLGSALSALDLKLSGAYENGIWNRMEQRFEKTKTVKGKDSQVAQTAPDGELSSKTESSKVE